MNIRALAAEGIGTFILLTFGFLGVATLGVATEGQGGPVIAILVVPFSFGLGLLAALAIGAHVSGGHYNPAVTLAALLDGRVTWQEAIGYVVAQVVGGLAGTLTVLLVTTSGIIAAAANAPGPTADSLFGQELHAFSIEAVLTAVFVAVILTVTAKVPNLALLVIPLTLVAIHYVGMLLSGASVNPVRSLAPAVVSGNYASLWVYLTGPFVGSILGWGVYKLLNPEDAEPLDLGDGSEDGFDELTADDSGDELDELFAEA